MFITIILVSISISTDAFSMALLYGVLHTTIKHRLILSLMVGTFHFFMPLIGSIIGSKIIAVIHVETHILATTIFFFVGTSLLISKQDGGVSGEKLNLCEMFLFSFAVSLDSLLVGSGGAYIVLNSTVPLFIFFISSFIFTYSGLVLGLKINNKIGRLTTFVGGILLIVVAISLWFF